ncbi:MAG: 50S ribosomal protein L6 [bacterium]
MSKVGNEPIIITEGVKVDLTDRIIKVSGAEGNFEIRFPKVLTIEIKDNNIIVTRKKEYKKAKSLHGLFRTLIQNAVIGVVKPWEKKLEVSGTGFGVKAIGEDLEIKVGFSHPVIFNKIDGVKYRVEGNKKIVISGSNKQLVGEVANKIKSIKKPDAYKGKGIKYEGEVQKLKPGKKAKTEGEV